MCVYVLFTDEKYVLLILTPPPEMSFEKSIQSIFWPYLCY